jgi:hypothetical protein
VTSAAEAAYVFGDLDGTAEQVAEKLDSEGNWAKSGDRKP